MRKSKRLCFVWFFLEKQSRDFHTLPIRWSLKFTTRSERELSVHLCCLHSFSSERWTWTSSDRTRVNVYLSPCLSSWKFVLRPDIKPLASPLSVPRFLSLKLWAVEQRTGQDSKSEPIKSKAENADDIMFHAAAGGAQTAFLSFVLAATDLCQRGQP